MTSHQVLQRFKQARRDDPELKSFYWDVYAQKSLWTPTAVRFWWSGPGMIIHMIAFPFYELEEWDEPKLEEIVAKTVGELKELIAKREAL